MGMDTEVAQDCIQRRALVLSVLKLQHFLWKSQLLSPMSLLSLLSHNLTGYLFMSHDQALSLRLIS